MPRVVALALPLILALSLTASPVHSIGVRTVTPTATPVPGLSRLPRATAMARQQRARAVPSSRTDGSAAASISGAAAAPTLDPIPSPVVVGDQLNLSGSGFTPGSVIQLFVPTPSGVQSFGPFTPDSRTSTTLSLNTLSPSIPLGRGFVTILVINTDQNFVRSNPRNQLLFGSPNVNLPTIMAINGVSLDPVNPKIPTAFVETVLVPGTTATIDGSGFNQPRVNLFTSNGNFGPLTPHAGGSSTQFQVDIPANAPTGPGSLQVVNAPYSGNVQSNTVSIPIGAVLTISSVTQNGNTITINGTGFSSLSVINLFNAQGSLVANIGGLWPTNGKSRVPLNVPSPTQLTFTVPPTALSGPTYVQVLNPPFIPFSTSGNDPDGGFFLSAPVVAAGGSSLRFFGNGSGDIDRVKIALDNPARPVDVGGDFTLEFWMKTASGNASGACVASGDNWTSGNVIFDRDVSGNGDFGEYGVSLFGTGGKLAFGINRMGTGTTICGTANVANGAWHHVAVTRSSGSGQMRIFVDGAQDASGVGPTGDISYRNGRPTNFPTTDPFLVIGAEKFDTLPAYHGWIDEVRLSTVIRYGGAFSAPSAPFATDANTGALYHFDEDNGNTLTDSALASGGPSNGVRRVGGNPVGPHWSTDTPFANSAPAVTLQTLTSSLNAPTAIANCGDNRLFINEQGGTIRIWDGTQLLSTPFLTLGSLSSGGEQGLLGLAFHPQYAQNGFFFIYYTDPSGNVTIARYHVSADPNVADPNSGVTLLSIPHPGQANHNGGQLQFGPDGYLYAGVGDGGGGCDDSGSGCNAQRNNLLLGKLLRLDVNQNVNSAPFYGIPPTNPFVGPGDPRDEIWAKGVRNPWRYTVDRLTHALFIGDVGQGAREEVDYQPAESTGGENYGWKVMEGTLCGTCGTGECPMPLPPCTSPPLTMPIMDYDHGAGRCAITGGYVYRGSQVPFLYGKYLFGDLCAGTIWWSAQNLGTWAMTSFATAGSLYTFGEDVYGELYVGRGNGVIAKIVP
jgi:glucose/arabinose dehydrogenase